MNSLDNGLGEAPRASPLVSNDNDRAYPRLALDADKYRHHLKDCHVTKDEEDAFLAVIWQICHTFVDIGWGLDSLNFLGDEWLDGTEKSGADSVKLLEQTDNMPSLTQLNQSTNSKEE